MAHGRYLEPVEFDGGEDGMLRRWAVHTYGEVVHSFIDRSDYHGVFAPGYRRDQEAAAAAAQGLSLLEIDHCVGNVELGDMNKFVDYYRDVFGFSQLIHYDDKVIHTEYSALMSKVMTNGNGRIKFPINEPAAGQEEEPDPGVPGLLPGLRHAAHRAAHGGHRHHRPPRCARTASSSWACRTPTTSRSPTASATSACPSRRSRSWASRPTATRRATSSRSSPGPSRTGPTFFFEIIERHGSRGFGVGNFKALFEAIEIEQARRGNL